MGNSIMSAIIGFMVQKMMGQGLGNMLSGGGGGGASIECNAANHHPEFVNGGWVCIDELDDNPLLPGEGELGQKICGRDYPAVFDPNEKPCREPTPQEQEEWEKLQKEIESGETEIDHSEDFDNTAADGGSGDSNDNSNNDEDLSNDEEQEEETEEEITN